jgi:hypothetical protein
MYRAPLIFCVVLAIASAGSASAREEPFVWRDSESGCAYLERLRLLPDTRGRHHTPPPT